MTLTHATHAAVEDAVYSMHCAFEYKPTVEQGVPWLIGYYGMNVQMQPDVAALFDGEQDFVAAVAAREGWL